MVSAMPEDIRVRHARPEEASSLSELSMRSKALWQYDKSFLADAKPDLTFRPGKFLPEFHVYVLEVEGKPEGFCSLLPKDTESIELEDLWIELGSIGRGYGRRLWNHAAGVARGLGFVRMVLVADPNAEPFYVRMGAQRIGLLPSPVRAGRLLPILEYVVEK
jgi:GNAT superfamily N-acetyltransferase